MKKYWPFLALSVLILAITSAGAQGQYQSPALNTNVAQAIVPYSEYYTVAPTSFPGTHIIPPEKFEPSGKLPPKVYYGSPRKEIPFSQYQTYATYTAGNTLWIQGTNSWTQSVIVPQGAFLSLIAVSPSASPAGVNGDVYEIDPEGQLKKSSYNFYPYSRMGFYADKIGQYILFYIIDGMVSNPILVQVVNYSPPPISYPYPPSYYVPAFYYYLDLFDVCPFGGQFCNGICCPPGRTCINGACLPIGQPGCPGGCPPDQACVNGVCQPIPCPDGRAKCSGQCCPSDKACVNGVCQPIPCPDGRDKCSGQCCPSDKACVNGACVQVVCPGGCPQDQTCVDGECKPVSCPGGCPGNQICLSGQCCPEAQKCGNVCCPPGHCLDGLCCPTGQKCGDVCCPDGQIA